MPNRIYKLKVLAIYADINVEEIYDDYEEARHHYENWKYNTNVMEAHGCVSLVEMDANKETHKFEISRELGDKQW